MTTTATRIEVVFVLGGPGSGKGTQCAMIASELNYTHLSAGDLLRLELQKKGSELAAKIDECITNGLLVPSSIMVALLKAAVQTGSEGTRARFLVDGFPRSRENLEAWFKAISDKEVQINFALFLDCPKEALTERLLERGKTSGRADDNIESVLKRFDTFEKESLPVVADLDRLGLVRRVSAIPTREVVSHQVRRVFTGAGLVPPVERTFAIIKPDAVTAGKAEAIIQRTKEDGFVVVAKIDAQIWTREKAMGFYSEHQAQPFFGNLIAFMTSGPVVQLCLEKVGAVKAWRKLAGPTNSKEAQESDPSSLRALYGTDGTKNAVHEDILSILAFRGFQVIKLTIQVMTDGDVRAFFKDDTAEPWFGELCKLMREGGLTTGLCLSRVAAVDAWQSLMGPLDPTEAREQYPTSLRAMFGKDRVRNAAHGSRSVHEACREIEHWFPELSSERSSKRWSPVGDEGQVDPRYNEMMSYVKAKVDPVMHPLLQRVLKARPADVVRFAAEDLLAMTQQRQQQQHQH